MELQQLRYFTAVAKCGSFVKAAEAERVSQPSLSQQIQKLETQLGAPLFDRLGRSLKLTRYGEDLLPRAQEILRQAVIARKSLESMASQEAGRLVAGVIPTILPYFLAPRLAEFHRRFPAAEVRIEEHQTAGLVDGLRSGHLDIAVLALPVSVPEIVCSELFRDPLVLIAPPGSIVSGNLKELKDRPLLLLREGHCLRDNVLTVCNRAHAQFQPVFEGDHLTSLLALVRGGVGISLVPRMAVPEPETCVVRPIEPPAFRRIGYARAKGHHVSPLLTAFQRWLREAAAAG